jgi:hypothetical protein
MWLLIGSIIVFNLVAFAVKGRKLSRRDNYTAILFSLLLQFIVDIYLDLKYDLYGYFRKGPDYEAVLAILGIYPAITVTFLNLFPYEKGRGTQALYILVWTAFSASYEWVAEKTDLFYYNGWKLIYSVPIYPILLGILLLHYRFIRKIEEGDKKLSKEKGKPI